MDAHSARLIYFKKWMHPVAEEVIRRGSGIDLVRLEYSAPEQDNWAALASAHGYHSGTRSDLQAPWFSDAALIDRCPNLLAICASGAGYDYVDVDACTSAGIVVCHQSGANREAVAEHALCLMIALSKKLVLCDRAVRSGKRLNRYEMSGNDIHGKVVGIVGLGSIGTRLAQMCSVGMGMKVLAYDPYLTASEIAARGAKQASLEEIVALSDFVSLHCPLTADTRNMFAAAQFTRMKEGAIFINTARGGTYNEEDLAKALADGRLAGAGLDVFEREPPPANHPLTQFDNVIMTPHSAGVTAESTYNMALAAAEQWCAIFAGAAPPRLVNPEVWPRYSARFCELLGKTPAPLN